MNWYTWPTEAAFDAWHLDVCNGIGIPHPNVNSATGQIDPDAQWTTAYTQVWEVANDDWRATVEDNIAAAYPDGLGIPSSPPPSPLDSL